MSGCPLGEKGEGREFQADDFGGVGDFDSWGCFVRILSSKGKNILQT